MKTVSCHFGSYNHSHSSNILPYRPLFVFKPHVTEKTVNFSGFELGWPEKKASALTTSPPFSFFNLLLCMFF